MPHLWNFRDLVQSGKVNDRSSLFWFAWEADNIWRTSVQYNKILIQTDIYFEIDILYTFYNVHIIPIFILVK